MFARRPQSWLQTDGEGGLTGGVPSMGRLDVEYQTDPRGELAADVAAVEARFRVPIKRELLSLVDARRGSSTPSQAFREDLAKFFKVGFPRPRAPPGVETPKERGRC